MAYKMKGFSGFKSSPVKHDKSAGGHSKKYGKHTNADHPNYWKEGASGMTEKEFEAFSKEMEGSKGAFKKANKIKKWKEGTKAQTEANKKGWKGMKAEMDEETKGK